MSELYVVLGFLTFLLVPTLLILWVANRLVTYLDFGRHARRGRADGEADAPECSKGGLPK